MMTLVWDYVRLIDGVQRHFMEYMSPMLYAHVGWYGTSEVFSNPCEDTFYTYLTGDHGRLRKPV